MSDFSRINTFLNNLSLTVAFIGTNVLECLLLSMLRWPRVVCLSHSAIISSPFIRGGEV